MIHLIITACMISHPHVCRNFELPLTVSEINNAQCLFVGQIEAAKPGGWKDKNPEWQLRSIQCAKLAPNNQQKAERAL
jgi:hypothetical protein